MCRACHDRARKEVTDPSIDDERFMEDVLRGGVELTSNIVMQKSARGRRKQSGPGAGVNPVLYGGEVQGPPLEKQLEIAIGSKRQIQAVLLDVLKSKEVHQSERIVIARVLLIIRAHAHRVGVAIARSVVVLPLDMR